MVFGFRSNKIVVRLLNKIKAVYEDLTFINVKNPNLKRSFLGLIKVF